ncbi:MAG: DUF2958 domain-containing protein [Mesorhizobium sp.]|nr:MAG: DUF2958 domain-containing protein [Mesorhizobium sp.]
MNEPTCNRMPLLAPELRWRLLENGRQSGGGHVLVVKFFNPVGIGAWHAAGYPLSRASFAKSGLRHSSIRNFTKPPASRRD